MKKIYENLGLGFLALALVVFVGATSASAAMPTNPSVMINSGATTTSTLSVTLTLSATNASMMEVSNDSTFSGSVWETYMTSKSWMLTSGDGAKTVYARFSGSSDSMDSSSMSPTVSASITVSGSGTTAPIVIAGCGNSTAGYSPLNGQSCATNTVMPTTAIAGCGNRNYGFSTLTGQSCATNTVMPTMSIPGCGNSTMGFSSTTGQSCANNVVSNGGDNSNSGGSNSLNTSEDSYDLGTGTLMEGSNGQAVMELQKFLNKFENDNLTVDGKIGPATAAIIKKWQTDHGLTADGKIGTKTKMKIQSEISGGGGASSSGGMMNN